MTSPAMPSPRDIGAAADVVERDLDHIIGSLKAEVEMLSGTRVLLTGGAGFLGYYFVQALMRFNDLAAQRDRLYLTVMDNFVRGVPTWIEAFADRADFRLLRHDVIEPLPDGLGEFDYAIHAAGIASPTFYRQHPLETMDANIIGLRRLLDRCRDQAEASREIRGMLFFSSSEIYGDPTPDAIPTPESYRGNVSCTGPRACYDESKRFGETLCVTFARQYGIPVAIARPFNNYGPGLKITDRRVISDFARNILASEDVVLLSTGGPTRTFCYSADAIVGYLKVLTRGRPGEPYNIGSEAPEISVSELAERVVSLAGELFGYTGRVVRGQSGDVDYLVDNPQRRCPSIEKAERELGYRPRIPLDEGLRRSLLWYTGSDAGAVA